jgi:hypothetical protein
MMMGTPTTWEVNAIHHILDDSNVASRISINSEKYIYIFFNTPDAIQLHLTRILGLTWSSLPFKYLGIPLIDYSVCNSSWEPLIDSLKHRLSSWTFRSLNIAGHLILLKSILQAIPIYVFSALAAPKYVLKTIRNIQIKFVWQGTKEGHKWALVKWEDLCKPKPSSDLGLRDPCPLNEVMGANI